MAARPVRHFDKDVFNRFALTFAGGRGQLARRLRYAVVHHVGRRSGRPYAAPVVAQPTEDGFIVLLPYGTEADCVRNLLAAGRGTIRRSRIEYPVAEPKVVDRAAALPAFRAESRLVIRLFGIERFLWLKRPRATGAGWQAPPGHSEPADGAPDPCGDGSNG